MNFTSTCRVCLLKTKLINLKPLIMNYVDNNTYIEVINILTGVNISNDRDGFPKNICTKCEEMLIQAYEFYVKIKDANSQLETMLSMNNNLDTENVNIKEENPGIDEESCDNKNDSIENDLNNVDNNCDTKKTAKQIHNKILANCRRCKINFSTMEEQSLHNKKVHPRKRTLCLICGKMTTSLMHDRAHQDDLEGRTYNCTICSRSYKHQTTLTNHMRVHTKAHIRYQCEICNRNFSTSSHRSRHLYIEHKTGETKFQCSICGKKFMQSYGYKSHMVGHTGERQFKCELCNKDFKTKWTLKEHMVSHTKEKNHKCDICDKGFGTRKRLREHNKIHTGEKNYVCPVCSEAFTQNHVMRTHVTKKHPKYVLPPSGTIVSQKKLTK